jgi:hypothetical protein
VTGAGAAFRALFQVCHPDSYELAAEVKPVLSDDPAALIAFASVVPKLSARVNEVDPLEFAGISPV